MAVVRHEPELRAFVRAGCLFELANKAKARKELFS